MRCNVVGQMRDNSRRCCHVAGKPGTLGEVGEFSED
jgi:hypothetical protein